VGQLALSKYGKNYLADREPIMVLITVSAYETEQVEYHLIENKYFDYKGVICIS
jgi:hypothetical protein